MRVVLMLLSLYILPLQADSPVSLGIDRAIEYGQAGRYDLASQQLTELLHQKLAPVEKAAVLYNLAVAESMQNKLWDALGSLNQINQDMYDEVVRVSPQLAVSISYDWTAFAIRYAKGEIEEVVRNRSFQLGQLNNIAKAIDWAKIHLAEFDLLSKKNIIPLNINEPTTFRTHLAEEIAILGKSLSELEEVTSLQQKSKSELLDSFADLLWSQFFDASYLFRAKCLEANCLNDYFERFDKVEYTHLQLYLAQLVTFLSAPAKKFQASLNDFFTNELLKLEKELATSLANHNGSDLLSSLYNLMSTVSVIQAQVIKKDIEVLLDERTAVAVRYSIDQQNDFWLKEWQDLFDFDRRYLLAKQTSKNALENALVAAMLKHLNPEPDVAKCLDASFYWKVLSTPESETFKTLAIDLHGARNVDTKSLKRTLEPLKDRIRADKIEYAIKPLESALSEQSPVLIYQDVMTGWFFADPEQALGYLFQVTTEGLNRVQTKQSSSFEAFIAHADYQLLLHFLNLLIKQQGSSVISEVLRDLNQKVTWFLDNPRSDFTFFAISLDLDWLRTILLVRNDTLEKITESVDFELLFQKKTLSLTRFVDEKEYLLTMDKLSSMQTQMAVEVAKGLSKISPQGKKIKQVEELLNEVVKLAPMQTKDVPTMVKVQDLLEQASQILHSLKSESEAQAQSSQIQQPLDLSQQMQKQALNLSPDNAIRLLQEMQREDKSLEQRASSAALPKGARPW